MHHQRLRCVEVLMAAARGVPDLVRRGGRGNAYLVDQLKRAVASAVLNATEGNGRSSMKERARFFDIAIASTAEAASAIDLMVAFGAFRKGETTEMSENLRIGYAMLINLKKATAGR